jgi:hypothetical protein
VDNTELLERVKTMTVEEKLALLSTTDKAYIRGYLDRAAFDFQPAMREPLLPGVQARNAKLPD